MSIVVPDDEVKSETMDIDIDLDRSRSPGPHRNRSSLGAAQFSYSGTEPSHGAPSIQIGTQRLSSPRIDAEGREEYEEEEKMDHRKRKRNRTIQSCLPCHQNKRKVGVQSRVDRLRRAR